MQRARPLATWDDLAALPEGTRAEVLAGVLVTPPSPLPRHARVVGALSQDVGGPFDVRKRALYARHGVAFYWLVDPAARTLEALRLDAATGMWTELGAYDDDSVARIAPFEAVELEVRRLFPPLPANAP